MTTIEISLTVACVVLYLIVAAILFLIYITLLYEEYHPDFPPKKWWDMPLIVSCAILWAPLTIICLVGAILWAMIAKKPHPMGLADMENI